MTGLYGRFFIAGSSPTNATMIRVILYVPKNSTDTMSIGYREPVDKDRYTILEERFLSVGTNSATADNTPTEKIVTIRRKLRMHTQFSTVGGTAADIARNPVRLYFASSSASDSVINGFIYAYYTDT